MIDEHFNKYKNSEEINNCLNRLLKSDKPKMIVADLDNENELTEQQIKHFKTAEYLWNLTPQTIEGQYKDKFMGVLLDESLNYVHIVFASKR
jgi:hypothetical protein